MKIFGTLLFLLAIIDPGDIARNNRIKSEAEKAYNSGNYELAAEKYSMLYDSLSVQEDEIALNLGHSYYALGDSSGAKNNYQKLTSSSKNKLKSIAYQQLGVMAKKPETLEKSLAYLKSSIKADPTNEEARYNYEVVKKLLEKQQEQQKDNKDQNKDQDQKDKEKQDQEQKDQEKQDQGNQEQKDQEQKDQEQQDGEKSDEEKKDEQQKKDSEEEGEQSDEEKEQENKEMSTKQKLEEMNISEEKAQMILEAMKNNEIQYIQQQKRKATKKKDSGKPDW